MGQVQALDRARLAEELPARAVSVRSVDCRFPRGATAGFIHGAAHADAKAVSYLAMMIWAYEVVEGINWFRHLLGLAYAISTANLPRPSRFNTEKDAMPRATKPT